MTPEPFQQFDFDGVLGLGLQGLALNPEFHFFSPGQSEKKHGRTGTELGRGGVGFEAGVGLSGGKAITLKSIRFETSWQGA